jgi:hypothetical protein
VRCEDTEFDLASPVVGIDDPLRIVVIALPVKRRFIVKFGFGTDFIGTYLK